MDDQSEIAKLVNGSGFPFQIAVADLVKRTKQHHDCRVLFTEHSWRTPGGDDSGFIDIVVASTTMPYVFVIECKRHLDAAWVFLNQVDSSSERRHAKLWVNEIDTAKGRLVRSEWTNAPLSPASLESAFCVVHRQDERNPMLERIASTLVRATECLAREDDMRVLSTGLDAWFYASLIVTSADLVIAEIDPQDISLETGTIPTDSDVRTREVPFLRFRKQLSFLDPEGDRKIFQNNDYRLHYAKERTVFVVQAKYLSRFLSEFQVDLSWRSAPR
jgi:hypothetical protein